MARRESYAFHKVCVASEANIVLRWVNTWLVLYQMEAGRDCAQYWGSYQSRMMKFGWWDEPSRVSGKDVDGVGGNLLVQDLPVRETAKGYLG